MKDIRITIDSSTLTEYEKYYFRQHPKASKKPIANPYHESMNAWMVMKRPMMNALKQRWKNFICWLMDSQGYANLHIDECDIKVKTFYRTDRRHDVDNSVIKFILDGFAESGFIVDDDSRHVRSLLLECSIDKDNPRTEIEVIVR